MGKVRDTRGECWPMSGLHTRLSMATFKPGSANAFKTKSDWLRLLFEPRNPKPAKINKSLIITGLGLDRSLCLGVAYLQNDFEFYQSWKPLFSGRLFGPLHKIHLKVMQCLCLSIWWGLGFASLLLSSVSLRPGYWLVATEVKNRYWDC